MTPGSASAACAVVLRRDLTLAWRRRGDIALPVLYAVIVTTLFPFALGPEPQLLALTAGSRRSGMLLALMLLPLCVPVVIFAAGAVAAAQEGLPWTAPMAWLGAGLSLAVVLGPLASASALRIAMDH